MKTKKEAIDNLIYCCMGMTEEYMANNMGEAKGWMGQVARAYREYEEVTDEEDQHLLDADIALNIPRIPT